MAADSRFYPHQTSPSRRPGVILVGIVLGLVLILPEADLKLLAASCGIAPAFWLIRETRRRQTGLTLVSDEIILRAPFGWRPLRIPYTHVGGVQPRDRRTRLGFVYYVPRPAFEGAADPRPPRVRAALTAPLADLPAALADLDARLAVHPPDGADCPRLSADQTHAYLQRRRLRRAALVAGLTLAFPVILIGLLRLGFDVYRALAYGFHPR